MRRPYNAQAAFRRLNRRLFASTLPPVIIKWRRSRDLMGAAYINPPLIVLNSAMRYWPKVAELTLLHEMVHIATGDHTHGRKFQQLMLKLARRGALANLW